VICFHRGAVIHKHRKVYLPTYGMFDEARYFGAGDIFRTFDAPWGRTGILICEDFWHLSSSYLLSQQGMDVLIVMSNSPTKALDASSVPASRSSWLKLGEIVASFFTCHVIYVNRTGYEDGWNYGGGSYAITPQGRLQAEGKLFKTDSVTASLRHADLRSRRTEFPVLRDEKLDLVRRELERIAAERYGEE
jgi:predicted amidohydrolase